jgi:hypothetical protein
VRTFLYGITNCVSMTVQAQPNNDRLLRTTSPEQAKSLNSTSGTARGPRDCGRSNCRSDVPIRSINVASQRSWLKMNPCPFAFE